MSALRLDRIRGVTVKDRTRGGLIGAGLGLALAAASLAGFWLLTDRAEGGGVCSQPCHVENIVLPFAIFGALGATIGFWIKRPAHLPVRPGPGKLAPAAAFEKVLRNTWQLGPLAATRRRAALTSLLGVVGRLSEYVGIRDGDAPTVVRASMGTVARARAGRRAGQPVGRPCASPRPAARGGDAARRDGRASELERRIGLQMRTSSRRRRARLPRGSVVVEYVRGVAARVIDVARLERPDVRWTVMVINDPKTVNAFATPGGFLDVYRGLLESRQRRSQARGDNGPRRRDTSWPGTARATWSPRSDSTPRAAWRSAGMRHCWNAWPPGSA